MSVKILDFKGPIIDEGIVSAFEKKLGMSLPDDYRKFLKTYNGGYPEPDAFHFLNSEDGSSIDRFLSLSVEKNHDLLKYYEQYKNRIPNGFLPIAHDPGGNLILIQIDKESASVYFWDHEQEADEGETPSMSNMYIISDCFLSFLDSLYTEEF